MSVGNMDLEGQLDTLPDLVADELEKWRRATLEREKIEALVYLEQKGRVDGITATELKARVNCDPKRYLSVIEEIKAEANYTRLLERLLSVKKRASLRVAF